MEASTSQSININSAGKSTNVYQAVTEKAMPSVVGITTTVMSSNNMFSIPTESEGVGTGISSRLKWIHTYKFSCYF